MKALVNSYPSITQEHTPDVHLPKCASNPIHTYLTVYSMGKIALSNLHFPFKRFLKFATEIIPYKDLLNIEF